MAIEPKLLLSEDAIATRVAEIAAEISRDYEGKSLHIIGVLKGAFIFLADLSRRLTVPHKVDFMALSSYDKGDRPTGAVRLLLDLKVEPAVALWRAVAEGAHRPSQARARLALNPDPDFPEAARAQPRLNRPVGPRGDLHAHDRPPAQGELVLRVDGAAGLLGVGRCGEGRVAFDAHLTDGKRILDEETVRAMVTPKIRQNPDSDGPARYYGYGWSVTRAGPTHTGAPTGPSRGSTRSGTSSASSSPRPLGARTRWPASRSWSTSPSTSPDRTAHPTPDDFGSVDD